MNGENEENIKNLARKTLKKKWTQTDNKYIELYSSCDFCFNASWNCRNCLCPDLICSERGERGFLKYLKNKYGDNLKINEFCEKPEYDLIIACLDNLIQTGKLSKSTENQINNLINQVND